MSLQSTHHSLLNSIPQIHHHPPNLTQPIKTENDDDVVLISIVPKVQHTPENYDPECQCSTCQLVRNLLAKCTCEDCRGTVLPGQSRENVPIANAVSPTNGQPSSSSIQNNDASTSEHTNANDLDDDDHSRSSTPNYLPRFFDDESRDSSSDDCEDDANHNMQIDSYDDEDDKELDNESEDDNDNSDPDYTFRDSSSIESEDNNSIDDGDDGDDGNNKELEQGSETEVDNDNSDLDTTFSETNTSNPFKISHTKISNKHTKKINSKTAHKCRLCNQYFSTPGNLARHHRVIHQKDKPFFCKWAKCDFVAGVKCNLVEHITKKHFKHRKDDKKANLYVGELEKNKIDWKLCPKCKRKFLSKDQLKIHLRAHKNPGFRCKWPKCTFFYHIISEVKKHVCVDHLKGKVEISDIEKVNKYFVKIDPQTGETSKIRSNKGIDLNLAGDAQPSTSCSSRRDSETKEDESSSYGNESNDNENDKELNSNRNKSSKRSNTKKVNSFDCPKCESSFNEKNLLLKHYRRIHQEWKPYYCKWPKCDFVASMIDKVVLHAYQKHLNSQDRNKAKTYVGMQKMTGPPPKDPIYESILGDLNCKKCGRNFKRENFLNSHLGTHNKIGFRCTWEKCGYFFPTKEIAKKHILQEHLKGQQVNKTQIIKHIVEVEPKTGRTSRIKRGRASTDHEEDSNSDDG